MWHNSSWLGEYQTQLAATSNLFPLVHIMLEWSKQHRTFHFNRIWLLLLDLKQYGLKTFSHHRTSLEVDWTLSLRKATKKKNSVYLTICIKEQVALWAGPIMRSNILLLHFRRKKMKCKIYIYIMIWKNDRELNMQTLKWCPSKISTCRGESVFGRWAERVR